MYDEYVIRIFLAALCGGVIGLERAYHDKSAGFRTMVLIATGSAFFTIISDILGEPIRDNARIAAAVVSGVGFLGAGVIIKDGMSVRGLTTAASIWLVASLGMGMGMGLYNLSLLVTIVMVIVLWLMPPVERAIDSLHEFLTFRVVIKNSDKQEDLVLASFTDAGVKVVEVHRLKEKSTERILLITAKTTLIKRSIIGRSLANCKAVLRFDI